MDTWKHVCTSHRLGIALDQLLIITGVFGLPNRLFVQKTVDQQKTHKGKHFGEK